MRNRCCAVEKISFVAPGLKGANFREPTLETGAFDQNDSFLPADHQRITLLKMLVFVPGARLSGRDQDSNGLLVDAAAN